MPLLLLYIRNVLVLDTEKTYILIIQKNYSVKLISTSNQNTRFQDFFFGIHFLSKVACCKRTEFQIFSEDVICYILVFCYNLEAANLKYNCWNKNFAIFKSLKESKADLAFLLKLQVCNSRVVIDHTFIQYP